LAENSNRIHGLNGSELIHEMDIAFIAHSGVASSSELLLKVPKVGQQPPAKA
jgi:hypothetical protein